MDHVDCNIQVNPDLLNERRSASFCPDLLTNILDGSAANTNRRRYIEHIIRSDPKFDGSDYAFLSRVDLVKEVTRKKVTLVKKLQELDIKEWDDIDVAVRIIFRNEFVNLTTVTAERSHIVRILGSDQQKERWLPLLKKSQITTGYAQTELGHGSHVRGIETRADFDKNTKEFVLNTPTISATKWCCGNLALYANYALVMAQLYTDGSCHGVHPFMVPIRDMNTHKTLPGIEIGDIGPMFGSNMFDFGFMRLTNVRVPRDNMLHKSGQVLDDGTYVKPEDGRLLYSGLLSVRSVLPKVAAVTLAQAVTIAMRYSCVRRQSEIKPGDAEPQVLDFQTQQHKLFPLLAMTYAYWFVGEWMSDFHGDVKQDMEKGDYTRLAEDHASASGLKAVLNWRIYEGVEVCRLACGGHGYSMASGIPALSTRQAGGSTIDGETTVLLLQTAKYLERCYVAAQKGTKLDASVRYLQQKSFQALISSSDPDPRVLLTAVQYKAAKMLSHALTKRRQFVGDQTTARNQTTVFIVEAAKAHIDALVMKSFVEKVELIHQSRPNEAIVLRYLCQIYGIKDILDNAAIFLQHQYLDKTQLEQLRDCLFDLYAKIRPEAVALVDAFDFDDKTLMDTILGRYDGQAYENLYKWAKDSPLNKDEVHESFDQYIKPFKEQAKL